MTFFWNPAERRLRTLWRLLIQTLLMVAFGVLPIFLIAEPLTALHRRGLFVPSFGHDDYDRLVNMIVGPFLVGAVIASVGIAGKYLDHRPLSDFGVRLDSAWWRGLFLGLGIATVAMAVMFAMQYTLGWVRITGTAVVNATDASFRLALGYSAVKVLCVGTYEEFVSRGYHLRNLVEGLTLHRGIGVSSLIFALLHLLNENSTILSTIGLFVNGLFFATAVLTTGRLSAAIGAHIGWNLTEGAVLGFNVSGDKEGASLLGLEQGGPSLATGGAFWPRRWGGRDRGLSHRHRPVPTLETRSHRLEPHPTVPPWARPLVAMSMSALGDDGRSLTN